MRSGQRRARPRSGLRRFGYAAIAAAMLVTVLPSRHSASADVGGGFVQVGTAFDSQSRDSPVATGDMNDDGTSDVVFEGPWHTLMVGLVQPDGEQVRASGNEPQVPYGEINDLVVGQLTADNNPDAVALAADPSTGAAAVEVFPGDGSGGLAAAITTDVDPGNGANGWLRVAVGDVNGDGLDDIAVLNPSGNDVDVLLSDGSGGLSLASGSPYAVPSAMQGSDIALADLNHDGHPDIAVSAGCYNTSQPYCADGGAKVLVWDGNAAGGFAPAAGSPFSAGTHGDIAIVDVNGDGRPDMAVGAQYGDVAVLLQGAAGRFAAGPDPPAYLGGFGHLVAGYDRHLNQAFIAVAIDNQIYVLLGSRSGALRQAPGSPYHVTQHRRTYILSAAAGTIGGTPDVVVQSYGSGTQSLISVWADHLTASASGPALRPRTTALFNDPGTSPNDITRYERSLVVDAGHIQQYQGWRPQIRASFYRLSDVTLAKDFVTAAANGASVQVLLDGSDRTFRCHGKPNCVNPAYKWLRSLNALKAPGTWMKTCDGVGPQHPDVPAGRGNGCIGQARDHNKFLLVSQAHFVAPDVPPAQAPLAQNMVLQTSSNNTPMSYRNALNNALLTVNQPAVYRDYVRYFQRLAASYASRTQPSVRRFAAKFGHRTDTKTLASHDVSTWSFPQRPRHDPVLDALDRVRTTGGCANAGAGTTDPQHNGVALAMSHIGGRTAVIRRLAALRHSGCNVDVAYADIGTRDRRLLAHAGVGLHRVCLASRAAPRTVTEYLHSKYMLVAGTQAGVGANRRVVYTGSANLDDQALTRTDDRLERYVEAGGHSPVFDAYYNNFLHLVHLSQGHQATRRCISDA